MLAFILSALDWILAASGSSLDFAAMRDWELDSLTHEGKRTVDPQAAFCQEVVSEQQKRN